MRTLFLAAVLATALLGGEDLKSLIEAAHTNEMTHAHGKRIKAAVEEYDTVYDLYMPQLGLSGRSSWLDEKGSFDAGNVNTLSLSADVVLFDGFRRSNALKERQNGIDVQKLGLEGYKKSLSLAVAQTYFALRNLGADLEALKQKEQLLETELANQEKFYEARIGTLEELESIRAEAAANRYDMASLQYAMDEAASRLRVLTGKAVETPEPSRIAPPEPKLATRELESIGVLRKQSEALAYRVAQVEGEGDYPLLLLNDTYTFYDFNDDNAKGFVERVDKQNNLTLTLQYTLADFGVSDSREQALRAQKMALDYERSYKEKESDVQRELSEKAIERSRAQVRAAELSLKAATKRFEAVERKYHAGVSDYVTYLDALTKKISAQSSYNRARHAEQMAYANYYYYAGYDLKEFVR